ncbi:MAG: hypothetical protein LBQ42_04920 [Synergistaceae bacterium]|nr:hypothetical protein [Synergistaceae bacterium]
MKIHVYYKKQEKARLEAERIEQKRIAAEQIKIEQEKIERERIAKIEQERITTERAAFAKREMANIAWKTETFGPITFMIDSSWEKKLVEDGRYLYFPPTSEPTGFIQAWRVEMSIGNLSDAEARSKLDGGISGMMGRLENAEEISRTYLKIGDKYAARASFYYDINDNDINDDVRGRADTVVVLFEDGATALTSLFTISEYEYSYKYIIETTLGSVKLDRRLAQSPTQKPTATPTNVSANFKKTMDSYEAFFDKYVDFMKKYKSSGNAISMLPDFLDYMTKYADAMEKLGEIDSDKLSAADNLYYIEVQSRISKKMLEVATPNSVGLERRSAQSPTQKPTATSTKPSSKTPTNVSANFKKTMDSYEAFVNQYVAFMKKYKANPTNLTLLSDSAKMMTQYSKWAGEINKIDSSKLSAADYAYYIAVTSRVSIKMLEAAAQ